MLAQHRYLGGDTIPEQVYPWELDSTISRLDPLAPLKLTKLADAGSFTRHDDFRHFTMQHVNVMCSVGPDVRFHHKTVIQQLFDDPDLIIFRPAPFLSSWMFPSAACCHGEYGSVCFSPQLDSLSLCLNLPSTCPLNHQLCKLVEHHHAGTAGKELHAHPFCAASGKHNTNQMRW